MIGFARAIVAILVGGWRASPGRMSASFALLFLNYVSWPLAPLALKHVTDAVVARDVRAATVAAAFLPLIALLSYTGGHLAQALWVELSDLNLIRVGVQLGDLTQGAPGLEHHERADYADRLELLRSESQALYQSIHLALGAVSLAAQFTITVVLLTLLQPLLLVLLLFVAAPLLAVWVSWERMEKVHVATADRMRQSTHLLDLAVRRDAAKEIRIFGLQDELRRRLGHTRRELRTMVFRAQAQGVIAMMLGQLVFAAAYVGGLLLVVRGAVAGRHSVGDVVLVVTLAAQTNHLVFDTVFMARWLQRSTRAMGRLEWLRDLVARLYPATTRDAPVPAALRDGIRFERVGFRYPGTDADVLRDLDLHLAAGTTVALVGENGAGKSTVVKLLCGFYAPTAGRVTVDGVDLARLPVDEWRRRIAAGFQDFVRFELLARESVGVGDLAEMDDDAAVAAAVERAAARDVVDALPAGLDTQLGKSYANGAELSGGQWQKVALARAMMRVRPLLLILDEPTSALDAHAEHVLFERYTASARDVARATGGVAVFVSHRFSTVRMADLIVVVDNGRIVELGTHDELTANGGLYADLFAIQASAYG